MVFDGTTNFTSNDVLNGFVPSQNAAMELVYKLRLDDNVGWVNGSVTENLGNDFTSKLNSLNVLEPNTNGNLAERILAAEQLFSATSTNKKLIILFSAGEISPFSLITELNVDPDIRIFTFGFEGLNESQDLMSFLADETNGEYYEMASTAEISAAVNEVSVRSGTQAAFLIGVWGIEGGELSAFDDQYASMLK